MVPNNELCIIKNKVDIGALTLGGWVLAKVLRLVFGKEAGGLGLGGSTTGKSGVEVTDTLHACSILSGTNSLLIMSNHTSGRIS